MGYHRYGLRQRRLYSNHNVIYWNRWKDLYIIEFPLLMRWLIRPLPICWGDARLLLDQRAHNEHDLMEDGRTDGECGNRQWWWVQLDIDAHAGEYICIYNSEWELRTKMDAVPCQCAISYQMIHWWLPRDRNLRPSSCAQVSTGIWTIQVGGIESTWQSVSTQTSGSLLYIRIKSPSDRGIDTSRSRTHMSKFQIVAELNMEK